MSTHPNTATPTRRRYLRSIAGLIALITLAAGLVGVTAAPGDAHHRHRPRAPKVAGMVIVESNRTLDDTWSALNDALEANPNINVIARIDHAAAAESVGLELAANRVVVFGNPALGGPLMAINQRTGIDLPQRIHVFEYRDRIWVGFNDTTYLAARHRLGDAPTLETIAGALRNFTGAAIDGTVEAKARGSWWFKRRPGLITRTSDADVDTTWDRLLAAIEASPADVAFTVDHQAAANGAGIELRPTRLVVFGNPNLGTPLMQKRPTAGIDLPLRFLVWEDEDGRTQVTTNGYPLARRHWLAARDLEPISAALDNFFAAATGSGG